MEIVLVIMVFCYKALNNRAEYSKRKKIKKLTQEIDIFPPLITILSKVVTNFLIMIKYYMADLSMTNHVYSCQCKNLACPQDILQLDMLL